MRAIAGPRARPMLSDDVFRDKLEQTLVELEAWVRKARDCATINIFANSAYWGLVAKPDVAGACPIELIFKSNQTFSLKLEREVFENRPIERFELFPQLVSAVEAGRIERVECHSTLTDTLLAVETKVELSEGFDWIGVHRLGHARSSGETADERRTHRFLPYRR